MGKGEGRGVVSMRGRIICCLTSFPAFGGRRRGVVQHLQGTPHPNQATAVGETSSNSCVASETLFIHVREEREEGGGLICVSSLSFHAQDQLNSSLFLFKKASVSFEDYGQCYVSFYKSRHVSLLHWTR